jgi:phosphoglucosamine mutase
MNNGRKLFGTDGIRGLANQYPMNPEFIMKIGMAAGSIFNYGSHRHRVIVGKDTRLSGYLVEQALTAGFISVGMDVILVGPIPTPAIGMLTKSLRADIGVMISASHNPYHDNGIKIFARDGYKLCDELERRIEHIIETQDFRIAEASHLGKAKRLDDASGRYIEFVKNTFPRGRTLEGLKIVLDAANGSGYTVGESILWELGAEVITVGNEPNGFNINDKCGSLHPELAIRTLRKHGADLAVILDGDADRLIMVDENGNVVNGDNLMAIIADHMHQNSTLRGGGIVATVMSNMGLEEHLKDMGLKLVRSQVGDRYVMAKMQEYGMNVGGEQSGHIIIGDYTTTGDGLVAALQIIAKVIDGGKPLSELSNRMFTYPQKMQSIRYNKSGLLGHPNIQACIEKCNTELNGRGRIVVRPSGTEALIRVMVEAKDDTIIDNILDKLVEIIKAEDV